MNIFMKAYILQLHTDAHMIQVQQAAVTLLQIHTHRCSNCMNEQQRRWWGETESVQWYELKLHHRTEPAWQIERQLTSAPFSQTFSQLVNMYICAYYKQICTYLSVSTHPHTVHMTYYMHINPIQMYLNATTYIHTCIHTYVSVQCKRSKYVEILNQMATRAQRGNEM